MNTAFDILVIVLSSLLGIFLILLITVVVFVLKIIASVKRLILKAEDAIDSAEEAALMLKRASGPIGAARTITDLVGTILKHKQGKE